MFSNFGSGKKPESSNSAQAETVNKFESTSKSLHGFDPDALERAAKAAKDLDGSKNSGNAIKLIFEQEITKQKEHERDRAQFTMRQEQFAIQKLQESEIIAQRTLEEQTRHDRSRADYRDQLERRRMADQINAQRHLQDEERQKAEESLRRQEELRRRTLEYESELKQQTEIARVKAESVGRINQERENHDLIIAKKKLEAEEYRNLVLDGVKLSGNIVGAGIQNYLMDKDKLFNTSVTITAIAFGIYASRAGTGVIGKYLEASLGKPSLIRETSRKNVLDVIRHPLRSVYTFSKRTVPMDALNNTVFEPTLESRLTRITRNTTNARANGAPFRNILLAGPPGTGKTLFAKGLARQSGLHYAIMTGGDVTPLGKDAVTEIHKIFDWAHSTNQGVLLFIDEADAFLRKRSVEKMSENLRNALNAFLYRTGESSTRIMLVYASNQPEQFDWAVNDRIDEIVMFGLPKYSERLRILNQYIDNFIISPKHSKSINVVGVHSDLIARVAKETDGYSGRELSKLVIAWQSAAYSNVEMILDANLFLQIFEESKESKSKKQFWLSKEQLQIDTITRNSDS